MPLLGEPARAPRAELIQVAGTPRHSLPSRWDRAILGARSIGTIPSEDPTMQCSLVLRAPAAGLAVAFLLSCSEASAPRPDVASLNSSSREQPSAPTTTPQQSGTTNRLQAISPVNDRVAWASGVGGTYAV